MFSGSGYTTRLVGILSTGNVGNQRLWPLTGSRNDITYISASKHVINEIPMAISMFSGSGNTRRQVEILPDV